MIWKKKYSRNFILQIIYNAQKNKYKKVFVGKTQKKSGEIQKSNIYKKKDKNGY